MADADGESDDFLLPAQNGGNFLEQCSREQDLDAVARA